MRFMTQLTLRARLAAGFALVLLLLAGLALVSLLQLARFNGHVEALAHVRVGELIKATQASDALASISRSTGSVVLLEDPARVKAELAAIRKKQGEVRELLDDLGRTVAPGREQALFDEVLKARAAYAPHEQDFLGQAEGGDIAAARDTLVRSTLPAQLELIAALDRFEQLQVQLSREEAARAAEAYGFTRAVIVGLALAALLLGVLLAASIIRSISGPIREALGLARRVAGGDLTVQPQVRRRDEMGQLLEALGSMTQELRQLVGEVASGAHAVADTSAQIAQGNVDLSQRTEEQASTLEETASSMEELTSTVTQNAENARLASQLAVGASEVARKGGQVVGEVVSTMTGISDSSRRISDIIGVIDGIAFQTNILALNAAVEAARAGEQGRGFAVVAAEVRSLAQRSAAAAKEIKGLIVDSVDKVEAGTRLVGDAGRTMDEIVQAVKKVSDLIAEIAAASREQSSGLEQVNAAVAQMEHVVQQNASLVEEATAAAESMKGQAATLLGMVARFRLGAGAQPTELTPLQPLAAAAAPVMPPAIAPIRVQPAAAKLPPAPPARPPRAPAAPNGHEGSWREF